MLRAFGELVESIAHEAMAHATDSRESAGCLRHSAPYADSNIVYAAFNRKAAIDLAVHENMRYLTRIGSSGTAVSLRVLGACTGGISASTTGRSIERQLAEGLAERIGRTADGTNIHKAVLPPIRGRRIYYGPQALVALNDGMSPYAFRLYVVLCDWRAEQDPGAVRESQAKLGAVLGHKPPTIHKLGRELERYGLASIEWAGNGSQWIITPLFAPPVGPLPERVAEEMVKVRRRARLPRATSAPDETRTSAPDEISTGPRRPLSRQVAPPTPVLAHSRTGISSSVTTNSLAGSVARIRNPDILDYWTRKLASFGIAVNA